MIRFFKSPVTNHVTLTADILTAYISNFWKEVYVPLHNKNAEMHLLLMCKVEFSNPEIGYRTVGDLRRVNFSDKELFTQFIVANLGLLNDSYKVNAISNITFSYYIKEGLASGERMLLHNAQYQVNVHKYNNISLPMSMNPNDYGTVLSTSQIEGGVRFIVNNDNRVYMIDSLEKHNTVKIIGLSNFTWTDTKMTEEMFMREIRKNIFYISNGELIVKTKKINAKPFNSLNIDKKLSDNNSIMTMDIETVNTQGILHPYCIAGYTPKHQFLSYAKSIDNMDIKNMFNTFITQLIGLKRVKTVYAHNLAAFDGVFLLKHLIAYPNAKVSPLIHNGKIICINFEIIEEIISDKGVKENKVVRMIKFKDSFLLLPMSLRKLCKAFGVDNPKGHFPILFNEDIHYKGPLPDISFWPDISTEEYLILIERHRDLEWDFVTNAQYYCMLDCKSLFEVLVKFNELVFKEFKNNIHSSLTLPSLAMRIYKSLYMPKNTLYQILGKVDDDIRESYTGGAVDVMIPSNFVQSLGGYKQLYYYDVNSLYPFIMASMEMPVGKPQAFEGDIRKAIPDAYGFFYCDITSPEHMDHPILQRRVNSPSGTRTIAGLGSWYGWISSVEYDRAIQLGYKIDILNGYLFEKANIFKEYVEHMYSLRMHFHKSDPMNLIAKLLMNSLYGKFGMNTNKTVVEIFNTENHDDLEVLNNTLEVWGEAVTDHISFDHHVVIVRKNLSIIKYNDEEDLFYGSDINVGIASMITACARIHMSTLKNSKEFNLYYTDTDSVVIDRPLPQELVGPNLGQLKLEHTIEKAVFLAPKVYGLLTTDGKEIIKIKGVKNEVLKSRNIDFDTLSALLQYNSSLELTQDKWVKKVIAGDISIQDAAYNLKATAFKRRSIYNIDGFFVNTIPYNFNEIIKI